METFRLLHLSDLHLSKPWVLHWFQTWVADILEELSRTVSKWGTSVDAIVITGDLANTGSRENLLCAKDFVSQQPGSAKWTFLRFRPTIYSPSRRISLLPGNHDRFQPLSRLPGCTEFDTVFTPPALWSGGLGGVHLLTVSKGRENLAMLSADFCLASAFDATEPAGCWGQGKVYADRLDTLAERTEAILESDIGPVIWLIHFAPECDDIRPYLKLIDSGKLIVKAEKMGVSDILCGHLHCMRRYNVGAGSSVRVYCGGSACCQEREKDTSIHLIDFAVEDGRIVKRKVLDLHWDSVVERFLPR